MLASESTIRERSVNRGLGLGGSLESAEGGKVL